MGATSSVDYMIANGFDGMQDFVPAAGFSAGPLHFDPLN